MVYAFWYTFALWLTLVGVGVFMMVLAEPHDRLLMTPGERRLDLYGSRIARVGGLTFIIWFVCFIWWLAHFIAGLSS